MPADDAAHASAEIEELRSRFPSWTIWLGLFTGHWWALPPVDHATDHFVEAATPGQLAGRIEAYERAGDPAGTPKPAPSEAAASGTEQSRREQRRPSNLLRIEGVTTSRTHRMATVAWPGGLAG